MLLLYIILVQNASKKNKIFQTFYSHNINKTPQTKFMKKLAKFTIISFAVTIELVMLFVGGFFAYINFSNQDVKFDREMLLAQNNSIDIFDSSGNKINANSGKKARVKINELPNYVVSAFVSIEDKDFYKHHGLNYKRIAKAFVNNIKSRSLKEGASTISQQLIKNTHLSNEKTIKRKLNEMALAKKLEKNFSKDEIMEIYLNVIYFGSGAKGIENASQFYFDKNAIDLTIPEAATLAGMIKSPKTYSPIYNPENCLKRRNLVLKEMLKDEKITQNQYDNSMNTAIVLANKNDNSTKNFYEEATLNEAEKILNLDENQIALNQYKIFTYQENTDQTALLNAIKNKEFYAKNSYGNTADGAGIVIDNKTGGITAFAGNSIYDISKMKRSPGSAIKPVLVYAPALENGKISPSSMILDEKKSFGNYSPKNVGDTYYGWITATKSVEKSLNIPAIKIMQANGIENSKKFAEKCGIKFNVNDNNYAIALGGMTDGTTIIELVNSYLPFSNNGKFIKANFIKKICDKNGKIIYQNDEKPVDVMTPETAYLMTDMLISSVKKGTSSRLKDLNFQIAGKTGTVGVSGTNYNTDVWSIAYTPQKTAGVWLGDSTMKPEYYLDGSNNGGTYATSMLKSVFQHINLDKTQKFIKPKGIVECDLDLLTLEKNHSFALANPETPDRYRQTAIFNRKYAPTIIADLTTKNSICKLNVEIQNNYPKISFNTIKKAKYTIFRIEEDTKIQLKKFDGNSNLIEYIDKNIEDDTTYQYYVEIEFENEKSKSNIATISTPEKTDYQTSFKRMINAW